MLFFQICGIQHVSTRIRERKLSTRDWWLPRQRRRLIERPMVWVKSETVLNPRQVNRK